MTLERAYSALSLKALDEKRRTFTGIATTPSTDRMGDIVEPKGAVFKLPIPLLWQHDSSDPIGWITSARITDKGIEIEGEVASLPAADSSDIGSQELAARLSKAWAMLKARLVRGLSIGFRSIESARIDQTYSYRFTKWEWLELSAVTIPANQDASITAIKSIDTQLRAASGHTRPGSSVPGVPGLHSRSADAGRIPRGNTMKSLNELLDARKLKAARIEELAGIMQADTDNVPDEVASEFDGLDTEVKALDTQIRIARANQVKAGTATPVNGENAASGRESRGGPTVFIRNADPEDKFKGQGFARLAMAKAAAFVAMKEGNYISAGDFAQARWGKSHPKMVQWIKAAVAGGGTGAGEWGAELAQSDTRYTGDFVEFLYSMTVFDRLPLRSVPSRVHIKGQDGAATGYWVGESKAIPVSKGDASDIELTPLKVGAIAICSKELIADSSPDAEKWIRDMIAEASAQRVDQTFFSAAAAVAGVSPAGILNGVTALAPTGTDAAAVRADLFRLYEAFLTAKNSSNLVHVMNPSLAKSISLMMNALSSVKEFSDLRSTGGTLEGDPVYTGDNVAAGAWLLLKPSDIWKIGDSGLQLSMTDNATIEQDSAPTGASDTPTAATATLVSLWQTESIGFKVVRRINWAKRRAHAAQVLTGAEYGPGAAT